MQVVNLLQLHEKYGDRVQFLFVYIREAGHMFPVQMADTEYAPDAPPESRPWFVQRVRAGVKHFGLRFPCLLDSEQEEVQKLYSAYPKRILVIDPAGRIAVDSGNASNLNFPWQKITDWLDRYNPV